MGRVIMLTTTILIACLSCSKPSDSELDIEETPILTDSDIIGVWRDGDNLISFSSDGYYSASLTNKHIDTGIYSLDGTVVSCYNSYNNKNTEYVIEEIKDERITCTVTFAEYESEDVTVKRTFTKTDERPASKDHFLIGKSWSYLDIYYGRVHEEFRTHNIAYQYSERDEREYKNEWYYFYIEPYVYIQVFTPRDGVQRASCSFNKDNDTGDVKIMKASIDNGYFGGISREL